MGRQNPSPEGTVATVKACWLESLSDVQSRDIRHSFIKMYFGFDKLNVDFLFLQPRVLTNTPVTSKTLLVAMENLQRNGFSGSLDRKEMDPLLEADVIMGTGDEKKHNYFTSLLPPTSQGKYSSWRKVEQVFSQVQKLEINEEREESTLLLRVS